ncbi:MAG: cupin domain-containing protein [Bacteroides sp.]|nr:cupin domain-containing protein [Phocaeicola faecicola]MCI5742072.1 cupin domain-containing protein [Bacteroides sp.]MDD6907426.1 cupin domain-containing protein [Bacteroidaceae bacterium]MDY4871514.1 cupin domain-containing protein [Phocaeicola faecicola]
MNEPQKAVEKTCSLAFMFDSESEWEATGDKGVVRKILGYNGQVMMVKIKFDKDAVGATHRHYHTQVTYVVSGKFEFTINGEKKVVSGGDALYMEPDVEHGCKCLEPGMLIDCFSPMRESFLK